MEISATMTAETGAWRPRRGRLLMTALVVAVLVGAGLRFIPTSYAAPSSNGQASTACAAT